MVKKSDIYLLVANAVRKSVTIISIGLMCKSRFSCSLGSLARLSIYSLSYLLRALNIYFCYVLGIFS